jgi:methyl-accepting chemotaxis protein
MKWFANLKIGKKLGLSFGLMLVLLLFLGFFATVQLSRVNATTVELASTHMVATRWLGELRNDISFFRRAELNHIMATTPEGMQDMEKRSDATLDEIKTDLQHYEAIIDDESEREGANDFKAEWQKYLEVRSRVTKLSHEDKNAAKAVSLGESFQQFNAANADLEKLVEMQDKGAAEITARSASLYSSSRYWVIGILVGGIILGILLAAFITHMVANPLRDAVDRFRDIAEGEGDLTKRLEAASQDEVGELSRWFNVFMDKLHEIICQVTSSTEHIASATEEISASANQQAQGAETQKDQTTQVATAMQEMSSTVMQVSDNSNRAADAARKAEETARQGGTIVEVTLTKMRLIAESVSATARKMESLGKSSDQIGRIIGVIDDIADQTNLLALNAAIEAARAGEQGRGFAVVADEVRKLAERTTTATKEIAQMIQNIQDETKIAVQAMEDGTRQVQVGVESTAHAGGSLKEIIAMSEQVGEMITHIATAATQQSSATEQVNNNMEQIAVVLRESATGAQQAAKACQALSNLALDLQNMVGKFKVDERQSRSMGKHAISARSSSVSRAMSAAAGH